MSRQVVVADRFPHFLELMACNRCQWAASALEVQHRRSALHRFELGNFSLDPKSLCVPMAAYSEVCKMYQF